MNVKPNPKVGLLFPTNYHYARETLLGLFDYVHAHQPWDYVTGNLMDHLTGRTVASRLDIVIGMFAEGPLWQQLKKNHIPVINLSEKQSGIGTVQVLPDNEQAGASAAQYFLEKKFTSFAFCGCDEFVFSRLRQQGYTRALRESGHSCPSYSFTRSDWPTNSLDPIPGLAKWLQALPKPCAIFCHADDQARRVLQECQRLGLLVPEEIAVLGCDNDQIECELAPLPISSVSFPLRRLGFEAGRIADEILNGRRPELPIFRLAPTGIITRRSTDMIAVQDPIVARALRFITGHAAEPIDVNDVVRACGASRRYLERRFHTLLGRTPKQEIVRIRIGLAKRLLAESLLPMPEVAQACGFTDSKMLATIFVRNVGQKPSEFRRHAREHQKSGTSASTAPTKSLSSVMGWSARKTSRANNN